MKLEEGRGSSQPRDVWASGEAYELYVGRWSRLVALKFLEWLVIPPDSLWLDVGSGTGALTETILQVAAPRAVKGIDPAEAFITFVREKITDTRATFQLGDAQALPVDPATYDAVVSGFVINFVHNPDLAAKEMARAVKPGGLVAAYVWDYASGMQFMRHFWNAAVALDPAAAALDEGSRFPLCNPGPLSDLFRAAGLSGVEVRPIDIWTVFKDFDDYWLPFLGGQGPAPGYAMSLSEERRTVLIERIRAALPFAIDGSIPLVARAWAVRGFRQRNPPDLGVPTASPIANRL
jgi:SAM-dependent methyltransferase